MKKILDNSTQGRLILHSEFLDSITAHGLLNKLKESPWSEHEILMFGKWIKEPRRVAFYADPGIEYTYSKNKLLSNTWTPDLLRVKSLIESNSGYKFNSLLINYYRNGDDYMGWHCDNESELGTDPIIASLSLGQERDFIFRFKTNHKEKIKLSLQSGDLLIMESKIQNLWDHSLPKRKRAIGERLNLTFRLIK